MSRNYNFAEVTQLLNELEECANRIHKLSSDFVNEVSRDTTQKAA